jgi:hypothetical protein
MGKRFCCNKRASVDHHLSGPFEELVRHERIICDDRHSRQCEA